MSDSPRVVPSDICMADPGGDEVAELSARARLRKSLFGQDQPAPKLGRFVVLRTLGVGGVGIVRAAYDPTLKREVALKVMRRDHAVVRERLVREAQALAQVSHPNVIPVYEVDTVDDTVFIAMELVDGDTLDRWRTAKPRSARAILEVMMQAGRGLAAAHAANLVHRDFKPQNCIVDRTGRVRVLDFGLVRDSATPPSTQPEREPSDTLGAGHSTHSALTQGIVGTPRYMAPEQATGGSVTARTDQFSFAVTLFELLTGHHPFARDGQPYRAANALPAVRFDGGTALPFGIAAHLSRALSADPAARYPSMDVLLRYLDPAVRRRWTNRIATLGVVGATVGLGVWGASQVENATAVVCPDLATARAEVWSEEDRQTLRRAFESIPLRRAKQTGLDVQRVLDGYADDHAELSVQACAAGAPEDPELARTLALRRSCLQSHAIQLGAMVASLATVDADSVDNASSAVRSLPGASQCSDVDGLLATEVLPFADDAQREAARGV